MYYRKEKTMINWGVIGWVSFCLATWVAIIVLILRAF
jgi:hypothetical protein